MKGLRISLALGAAALACSTAAQAQGPEVASALEFKHFMSAYSVADMEAVTRFYVDVLNFEVVKDVPLGDAMHFRWLRNGNQGIELVRMANSQPGPARGRPPAHLAVRGPGQLMLQVDNLEATKAALIAKGATIAVDITSIAALGIKVLFVNDPEGNPIEIVEVTDG